MAKALFCTVKTSNQATLIVDRLKASGFNSNDISVLTPDESGSKEFAIDNQTKAPEGAIVGTGTGALLGSGVGWLVGIGVLAVPGVGPFIAAGPIMAALAGMAVGGSVGGIAGALFGMGIPEFEAKRYEGKLKGGHCLISVHSEDPSEYETARRIFKNAKAEDISETGEPSVHEPR